MKTSRRFSALVGSVVVATFALLGGCAEEQPPQNATGGGTLTIDSCAKKNSILEYGKCQPCGNNYEVENNQCQPKMSADAQAKKTECETRGATYDRSSLICSENKLSCLRVQGTNGSKVIEWNTSTRTAGTRCVDRVANRSQTCTTGGQVYESDTDRCIDTEDTCRKKNQAFDGIDQCTTGQPSLTNEQQAAQQALISQCLANGSAGYNPATAQCTETEATCKAKDKKFDPTTNVCKSNGLLDIVLPILPGLINGLFNSN